MSNWQIKHYEMNANGKVDIESYLIGIAHIYAHLNRAWNSRDFVGEMTEEQREDYRSFPEDIVPIA